VGILAATRKSVNGARGLVLLVAVLAQPLVVVSIAPQTNEASTALQQFLAAELIDHAYRTTRCLTAEIGSRRGWLWASTRTDPHHGFSYSVIAEGGSGFIRGRVLHPLLEAERKLVADHGQDNAAFSRANYEFHIQDRDENGLLPIRMLPRRRDRLLIDGGVLLRPATGELVLVKGRLAKSPSFWITSVDVVHRYAPIEGVVLPVSLESTARLRFLGSGTLNVRRSYTEVDGRSVHLPAPLACGAEPHSAERTETPSP